MNLLIFTFILLLILSIILIFIIIPNYSNTFDDNIEKISYFNKQLLAYINEQKTIYYNTPINHITNIYGDIYVNKTKFDPEFYNRLQCIINLSKEKYFKDTEIDYNVLYYMTDVTSYGNYEQKSYNASHSNNTREIIGGIHWAFDNNQGYFYRNHIPIQSIFELSLYDQLTQMCNYFINLDHQKVITKISEL